MVERLWLSLLWATLSLLFGFCESLPSSPAARRQVKRGVEDEYAPLYPEIVWRGEHIRSSDKVYDADGFFSRGLEAIRKKEDISTTDADDGSSLFMHSQGFNLKFSQYVSTTTSPEYALSYARDKKNPATTGYVYLIHADEKMIDARASLREHGIYRELEQSVAGYVPADQIMGHYVVTRDNAKSLLTADKRGFREDAFVPNPLYKAAKYEGKKGSGAQFQLAGFPKGSPAWEDDRWKEFADKSMADELDDFIKMKVCNNDLSCYKNFRPVDPREEEEEEKKKRKKMKEGKATENDEAMKKEREKEGDEEDKDKKKEGEEERTPDAGTDQPGNGREPNKEGDGADKEGPPPEAEDSRCKDKSYTGSRRDRERDNENKKKPGTSWRHRVKCTIS
ncbi:heat-labile enterotoxin alpha chain domain-containing protein [Hirsutella rhossiliensis]|uniref:Heat-labile enterotoxin alpha chain domain-containing protein n=1 Tax=Hirsutella rhossiliensis TaxID=111463 RepID=A0A9P8SFR8_9HYPO|nr:heat-labile enterotoxin alpha chain domain-containing protein [Hirsutella rhossiliensis]KAH0961036.1 heat-labile enterotoxin alpha chain domain-containing protein [Hirsutella rhossiliensis]